MNNIRNGNKTIELRLYDEKRQKISVGDVIKFVNSKNIYIENEDIITVNKVEEITIDLINNM